jgi:hypothetical protein
VTAIAPTVSVDSPRGLAPCRTGSISRQPSVSVIAPTPATKTKIARQPATARTTPPASGPAAIPTLAAPAHHPIARARRDRSANSAGISASVAGTSAADPMACKALPVSSMERLGAVAHHTPPMVRTAAPPTNMPRLRIRPVRPPEGSSRAAYTTMYELATHCRPTRPACRLCPICGRAIFTIVLPSVAWATPRHTTASAPVPPGGTGGRDR